MNPSEPDPKSRQSSEVPTPVRASEEDLQDIAAWLKRLDGQISQQEKTLDRLGGEPGPEVTRPTQSARFIVTATGETYERELDALQSWVATTLLPTYAREVSAAAPWCPQWATHPEAVARLHALWMAWEDLTSTAAGPTGPGIWHRDYLDHAMAQLRSPNGPFAACMTNPKRTAHRVLAPPPGPECTPGAEAA